MTTVWHRLDRFLALLRPHREPISLLIDGLVIAACWNVTYLFRLGFERWLSARPAYDTWVMLGVIVVYLVAFAALRVPQSMWRFSGFGDIKRLSLACAAAGLASAAIVMALGLTKVPRARARAAPLRHADGRVRGAHRLPHGLRACARGRSPVATPRSVARWCWAPATPPSCCCPASTDQGWIVLGLLDDDPAKQGARIAGVPVLGPLAAMQDKAVRGAATHVIMAIAFGARPAAQQLFETGRIDGPAGAHGALVGRAAGRHAASTACATSNPKTCSAASRCSSTRPASTPACAARRC